MKQAALAEACRVSVQTVSDWALRKTLPSCRNLRDLGTQTGVSLDWLLVDHKAVKDSVPMMRADRSTVGALADALLQHVLTRSSHYVNDPAAAEALALVVHSRSTTRRNVAIASDRRTAGIERDAKSILFDDHQQFLNDIVEWVQDRVEEGLARRTKAKRREIAEAWRRLLPGHLENSLARRVVDALMDPHSYEAADVLRELRELSSPKGRQARLRQELRKLSQQLTEVALMPTSKSHDASRPPQTRRPTLRDYIKARSQRRSH